MQAAALQPAARPSWSLQGGRDPLAICLWWLHQRPCMRSFAHGPALVWGARTFGSETCASEAVSTIVHQRLWTLEAASDDWTSCGRPESNAIDDTGGGVQAVSLKFVMQQLHEKAAAHKSPKVYQEAAMWMCGAVGEFGIRAVDTKATIQWTKAMLAHGNPGVRDAGVELSAALYQFLGGAMEETLTAGLKPSQVAVVKERWSKSDGTVPGTSRKERGGGVSKRPAVVATGTYAHVTRPCSRNYVSCRMSLSYAWFAASKMAVMHGHAPPCVHNNAVHLCAGGDNIRVNEVVRPA
jgi:hypothetical protein